MSLREHRDCPYCGKSWASYFHTLPGISSEGWTKCVDGHLYLDIPITRPAAPVAGSVRRYSPAELAFDRAIHFQGKNWIKDTDYAALQSRCEELEKALDEMTELIRGVQYCAADQECPICNDHRLHEPGCPIQGALVRAIQIRDAALAQPTDALTTVSLDGKIVGTVLEYKIEPTDAPVWKRCPAHVKMELDDRNCMDCARLNGTGRTK